MLCLFLSEQSRQLNACLIICKNLLIYFSVLREYTFSIKYKKQS